MPSISSNNQAKLRQQSAITNVRINLMRREVKATARINQSSFVYPLAEVTVDTISAAWTQVRESEYYEAFNLSGERVYSSTHRRNPNSTTLFLDRITLGTDQRRRFQAVPLGDNLDIVSYTALLPSSFITRADESVTPTVIYKRVDRQLIAAAPQTQYPIPQPNIGTWQQADADPTTGRATFTVSATESFSFIGGTLTYLWELPSSAVLTVGTLTSATITFTLPPGQFVVNCRVEDSAIPMTTEFRQKRGFRYFFVNDATTYPAFSDQYRCLIESDIDDIQSGRNLEVTAYGSGVGAVVFDRQPFLLTYDIVTSNDGGRTWQYLDGGLSRQTVVGYVSAFPNAENNAENARRITFSVLSPLAFAYRLPIKEQELRSASTVTNWQQTTAALCDCRFGPYYIAEYHAPAFWQLHNFNPGDGALFKKPAFPMKSNNIGEALTYFGEQILGYFTCASDGTMSLKRNPTREGTTFRNSVANVWTWQDSDVVDEPGKSAIQYSYEGLLEAGNYSGVFWISGTDVSASPVECRSNLFADAQGISMPANKDYIALSKDDGLEKTGHLYQEQNSPVPTVPIRPKGLIGEFIRPADVEWHTLNLAAYDPISSGVYGRRTTPLRVVRNWEMLDGGGLKLTHEAALKPETFGQPATEYVRPVSTGTVTLPPSTWCYIFDFRNADALGWTAVAGAGGLPAWANYVTGTASDGWQRNPAAVAANRQIETIAIYRTFPQAATITSITIELNTALVNSSAAEGSLYSIPAVLASQIGVEFTPRQLNGLGPIYTVALDTPIATSDITVGVCRDQAFTLTSHAIDTGTRLIRVTLRGTGINPFGTNNCV